MRCCSSWLFRLVVLARLYLFHSSIARQARLGMLVVSVGNITVGGTGKTPVVELLARTLTRRGRKVAILTRGYKSSELDKPQEWRDKDGRLPEISQLPAWFSVLRLPALAAAHLPECTELARQLLTALGMPRTLRAWAFLPEMAALTVVHPPLLTDVTHGLYPLMAHRAQLTPCAVERRLRLAIESTWNRGDYDAIARFFGQSVDPERGKPTNREFLCQLQERLTLSARRMERRVG